MKYGIWLLAASLILPATLAGQGTSGSSGQKPVVRAVLFYSPTCPHCHKVITVDLPPLLERYGAGLRVVGVDVSRPDGQEFYQAAVRKFAIPEERLGVPTLVVGSRVLVGDAEIPAELPGIVDQGLAVGGIAWPAIPVLQGILAEQEAASQAQAQAETPPAPTDSTRADADSAQRVAAAADTTHQDVAAGATNPARAPTPGARPADSASEAAPAGVPGRSIHTDTIASAATATGPAADSRAAESPGPRPDAAATRKEPRAAGTEAGKAVSSLDESAGALASLSMMDRFRLDPTGGTIAVAVMLFMILVLLLVVAAVGTGSLRLPRLPAGAIPLLALTGIAVAAYLSYVEITGTAAVCGPVGDCNTVQQSEYARLFGWLPVGVLGLLGYAAMVGAWLLGVNGPASLRRTARIGLWSLALGATLFSVYLTFLEPFIIGATCAWCLSSAVIVTLLLLAATPDAVPIRPGTTASGP